MWRVSQAVLSKVKSGGNVREAINDNRLCFRVQPVIVNGKQGLSEFGTGGVRLL